MERPQRAAVEAQAWCSSSESYQTNSLLIEYQKPASYPLYGSDSAFCVAPLQKLPD